MAQILPCICAMRILKFLLWFICYICGSMDPWGIAHHYDYRLSKEIARIELKETLVAVSYYTNRVNTRSVVHSHSYHEIVYNVLGSDVLYFADGNRYTLQKDDVIFFPKEHFHNGVYNLTENQSERLVVQIDPTIWNIAKKRSLISWDNQPLLIGADTAEKWDLKGLFERMARTGHADKNSQMMIYESQILELQLLVNQFVNENKKTYFTLKNDIVERAIKYLQQNYTNPLFSVEELANNACVSRAHLSRVFKTYTLESIHEYLTELRMQKCRQMIAEGNGILDSSIESGFSDYSSFVKAFKKLYNMTPQEFRKMLLIEIKRASG